jgi:CBS domain containing-hemolysin-like protein
VGIVEVNGVPAGLVTIKDLIEPLTGELADV